MEQNPRGNEDRIRHCEEHYATRQSRNYYQDINSWIASALKRPRNDKSAQWQGPEAAMNMSNKQKIVLASNNPGKLEEIRHFLADFPCEIISQSEFSIPEIAETGSTFLENALIKARYAAQQINFPVIGDDSGLEVDALDGAPGIYSARYAGKTSNAQMNNEKLLQALLDVPWEKRTARFRCVIVYLQTANDPGPIICQGVWEGFILSQPRGEQGFGYDPLFYVPLYDCSAAELSLPVKNQISHRAQALQQLIVELKKIF
jgi:XTP/dITP diphosphohydrolase